MYATAMRRPHLAACTAGALDGRRLRDVAREERVETWEHPRRRQTFVLGTSAGDAPVPVCFATYRFSLHFPVSMTYLTPGIVKLVSAIFVANMHLRVFGAFGVNIRAVSPGGCAAYMGSRLTC